MNFSKSGLLTAGLLISLIPSQHALAEINLMNDSELSKVEGQFLISGLLGAYVAKEIIIGEIIGEAISISEDAATKANLIDAFRPNNDSGPLVTALKIKAGAELAEEILSGGADTKNRLLQLENIRNSF